MDTGHASTRPEEGLLAIKFLQWHKFRDNSDLGNPVWNRAGSAVALAGEVSFYGKTSFAWAGCGGEGCQKAFFPETVFPLDSILGSFASGWLRVDDGGKDF